MFLRPVIVRGPGGRRMASSACIAANASQSPLLKQSANSSLSAAMAAPSTEPNAMETSCCVAMHSSGIDPQVAIGGSEMMSSRPAHAGGAAAVQAGFRSAGMRLFDGFRLDPVEALKTDQILDFLAQQREPGGIDAGIAAAAEHLGKRLFDRKDGGAKQQLGVDTGAVAHPFELGERVDRPAVAVAAALHPDQRQPCPPRRGNNSPRSAPTSAAALIRAMASSRPNSRQVSVRAMMTKSRSISSR